MGSTGTTRLGQSTISSSHSRFEWKAATGCGGCSPTCIYGHGISSRSNNIPAQLFLFLAEREDGGRFAKYSRHGIFGIFAGAGGRLGNEEGMERCPQWGREAASESIVFTIWAYIVSNVDLTDEFG